MASWLLMTESEWESAAALDEPGGEIRFGGRVIDNPLANNIGEGTLVGAGDHYVVNAVLLNDPDYQPYYALCSTYPIITVDPGVLFLPDPEV